MEEEGGNEAFIDQAHQERQAGLLRPRWPSEPSRERHSKLLHEHKPKP